MATKSIHRTNGKLSLDLDECELRDYDRSGRRRPVPKTDCVISLDYDTIFAAIGQAVDGSFSRSLELRKKVIAADRHTLAADLPGVFARGDAVKGMQPLPEMRYRALSGLPVPKAERAQRAFRWCILFGEP